MISKAQYFISFLPKASYLRGSLIKAPKFLQLSSICASFSTVVGSNKLEHDPKIPQFLKASDFLTPRHIGPNEQETSEMLKIVGVKTLEDLMKMTIPSSVLDKSPFLIEGGEIPEPESEHLLLQKIRGIAEKNKLNKCYIGGGYYGTITPEVVSRNVLENPNWYTAYTPYQGEISQGRLETILNFQTLCHELAGLEVSNASLLDEGTACAEGMMVCYAANNQKKHTFFVADNIFPQSLEVIKTRAEHLGIKIIVGNPENINFDVLKSDLFGMLLQSPDVYGILHNYQAVIKKGKSIVGEEFRVVIASDPLALVKCISPGEMNADIAVGNMQRFGVPMGFGGPHAAFLVTHNSLLRKMPGRIIGISKDRFGERAFRMTLQTREQHIKREKATSNICTAQVLLANTSAFYAIYHGKQGLNSIASRVNGLTQILATKLKNMGYKLKSLDLNNFFDTLTIILRDGNETTALLNLFYENHINLGVINEKMVRISLDETTTLNDLEHLISLFSKFVGKHAEKNIFHQAEQIIKPLDENIARKKDFLNQEIFNRLHSEHQMLRYIQMLANKDITLTKSMISLGSCTMKLNATTEMRTISIPHLNSLHPFTPPSQTLGYQELLEMLKRMLKAVTKFDDISLMPNSGAQGEYAGLSTIKAYLKANGQGHRNICLIPASAHGTNPATAQLCGLKVIVTKSDSNGNIDLKDLREKAELHKGELAAFMVTYPSTHGVYEDTIKEAIEIIHNNGGQVYMDGANMNAQCGWTSPGYLGADVCHLNLHKTFCIPHGGGGPGMGPIGVKAHLASFLPGKNSGAVCSAPFGSASILPISIAYIWALGKSGIVKATAMSILNANYLAERLRSYYPILYQGNNGRCAHEFLLDFRPIKAKTGITEEDVAKRFADFGFHAPTMSFPVPGAMLIEPTESEDKQYEQILQQQRGELDRFVEALIKIKEEIKKVEDGVWDKIDNPLKNAPHPAHEVNATEWKHCYSREEAAYPLPWVKTRGKYWPPIGRIDNVYGDRNPVCTCPSTVDYIQQYQTNCIKYEKITYILG